MFRTLLTLCTTCLVLAGCGGGGGSDGNTPNQPVTSVDNTDIEQLKIDSSNDLSVNQSLEVVIETTSSRSFLSICPDPGMSIPVSSINYDQCMVRLPLQAGVSSVDIDVANHVDVLAAVIWFYDGRDPLLYRWQRDNTRGTPLDAPWQITEGS